MRFIEGVFRILTLLGVLIAPSVAPAAEPVTRFAFGSCCKEFKPAPIFEAVNEFRPDVWIWMGDNIYGDTEDMTVMKAKYDKLRGLPGYATLRSSSTVIGTWDDHDFGENDAGREYPARAASQQCFLDFLDVPVDSARRKREGVYASHTFGTGEQRVKVLLLDTRYHREQPGPKNDILGEAQWKWLERELVGSTAAVHLLVSSIQVVASEHRFEKWANFPTAHKRLYALLSREDVPPVTILSGDRHLSEISIEREAVPYPLLDLTSSSLNAPSGGSRTEPNKRRLGENFRKTNFGTIEIDWASKPPKLDLAIRDEKGTAVRVITLRQSRSR